jgi:hypothetical protein
VNAGAAIGLEEGLTVGPIRLAPAAVGLHMVWGQQDHLEATGAEKASPEVRRGAAFQNDTTAKRRSQNRSNWGRENRFRSRIVGGHLIFPLWGHPVLRTSH